MHVVQGLPDRRKQSRVNIGSVVAKLNPHDNTEPLVVCVWNLSRRGACLLVQPNQYIPDRFDFVLDHAPRPARVIWRSWNHIGICFEDDWSNEVAS